MREASDKSAFRRMLKERLAFLRSDSVAWERSEFALSANLKTFLEGLLGGKNSPFILGVFAPLGDEPQWPQAFGGLDGKWWVEHACGQAFPRHASDGSMGFHRASLSELEVDRTLGPAIKVPPAGAPLVVPQAILVPALGLGPEGERMGRGKGFYDRYLGSYRGL